MLHRILRRSWLHGPAGLLQVPQHRLQRHPARSGARAGAAGYRGARSAAATRSGSACSCSSGVCTLNPLVWFSQREQHTHKLCSTKSALKVKCMDMSIWEIGMMC